MPRPFTILALLGLSACPPPESAATISFFRATPETVLPGDATQLEWSATSADHCTLSPGLGSVSAAGAMQVSPDASTTYLLECGSAVARVAVAVKPTVAILSFDASPADAVPDTFVNLSWDTVGADQCSIDNDTGKVPVPSGTVAVQPGDTTTYTLTCQGFGGPTRVTATVTITPATALDVPTDVQVTPRDGSLSMAWAQSLGVGNLYLAEVAGLTSSNVLTLRGGFVVHKVRSPFLVTGLVNGRTYFLRVSAASGAVESALTPELSAAPVDGPHREDPYYAEQWHLKNTGQAGGTPGEDLDVEPAWESGRGEGVRAAIVDEGVDLGHEDLQQNVAPQQSHDYLGNAALALAEHGTCVAGLVAARDWNGLGVRGVAPRAQLVSFNVLQDPTSANEYDAMTRQEDVVSLSNNSWGDAADGTGLLSEPDTLWLRGVEEGTRQGRGGKGVVYLWAAGNGGDETYLDNANYDGQANRRFVLAIGGVGDDGNKASYSEDGANVLVATPTGGRAEHDLTTTDITGALGYNQGDTFGEHPNPSYSMTMNGTSASTPLAAGAVALILQANPQLTWRDVRRVLAYTARKNRPSDADWRVNGAGLHVNHRYGFGVVDVAAAVALARTFTAGAPEVSFASPLAAPGLAIPDDDPTGASTQLTIAGSGVGHLEFVELTLTVPHGHSGELEISLAHDNGPPDLLHVPHRCQLDLFGHVEACSDISGYTFGSVRHLDEPADGRWTLTVKDTVAGRTGTLQSWKLNFYGRP